MREDVPGLLLLDRLKWWVYERCFDLCVWIAHPDADPSEFCLLDQTYFIAIGRDEAQAIIKETPEQAWRLEALLEDAG